jgi:hypothetical protein
MTSTDTRGIGYLLNYVFNEIIISNKLFRSDKLHSSGRTRLMAIKILVKLHEYVSKDIFNYDTEIEIEFERIFENYDTYQGIKIH